MGAAGGGLGVVTPPVSAWFAVVVVVVVVVVAVEAAAVGGSGRGAGKKGRGEEEAQFAPKVSGPRRAGSWPVVKKWRRPPPPPALWQPGARDLGCGGEKKGGLPLQSRRRMQDPTTQATAKQQHE